MTVAAPEPSASPALERTLVRGVAWQGAARALGQVLSWTSTLYVARTLTPTDYGIVAMSSVAVNLISMLGEFGIGAAVVQRPELDDDQARQLHALAVLLGLVSGLALVALAYPVGWFFHSTQVTAVLATMSLSLAFASWRTVPLALLQREHRFAQSAAFDLAQSGTVAVLAVVLAASGFGLWTLVVSQVAGTLLAAVLATSRRPVAFRRPQRTALGRTLRISRDILVSRLSWYLYTDADFFVAGRLLGAAPLGAYSFSWTIASLPIEKVTSTLGSVLASVFARLQHDRNELRRYVLAVTEVLAVVTMPANVGLALCAPELVHLGLGPQWASAVLPLRILAVYAIVRALLPVLNLSLTAMGDTAWSARNNIATALTLPVAFYAGAQWGIVGIAFAWMLVHPLMRVVPLVLRARAQLDMGAWQYFTALRPAAVSSAVMLGVVASVVTLSHLHADRPVLALKIGVGALAYVVTLLALFPDRVRAVRARLHDARQRA